MLELNFFNRPDLSYSNVKEEKSLFSFKHCIAKSYFDIVLTTNMKHRENLFVFALACGNLQ